MNYFDGAMMKAKLVLLPHVIEKTCSFIASRIIAAILPAGTIGVKSREESAKEIAKGYEDRCGVIKT